MIAAKRFVKGVPKSPSSVIALFIPPLIKKITIFMMVIMMIKMINPVFLFDCVKYASFQMQVMTKAVKWDIIILITEIITENKSFREE